LTSEPMTLNENLISSWPDCWRYLRRLWVKSLQWFRRWQVHDLYGHRWL